jgi:hypothetical protein
LGKDLVEYSEKGAEATEGVQIPDQLAPLPSEEPRATNGIRAPFTPPQVCWTTYDPMAARKRQN